MAMPHSRRPASCVHTTVASPHPAPSGSRRAALAVAALTALAACDRLSARADDGRAESHVARPDSLTTISSAGGVLEATLTAAMSPITIGGTTFPSMVYDGAYLPPVLRVRRGDSLKLHLVNRLEPSDEVTNLHYHGTSVRPRVPSDNIFVHVEPGRSYDYRLHFPPGHDRGLFWYHPHPHGRSEDQVLGGMSGVLVVEGFLEGHFPWLRDVPEEILMLKALRMPGAKTGAPHTKNINGQLDASFTIRPGELQFWRIANIAADAYFNLQIDGHRVWLLANDANVVRRPILVDSLFLPPGARAEVLVHGGPPGRYAIRHRAVDTGPAGDPNPAVQLGTLESTGAPVDRTDAVTRLNTMAEVREGVADIERLRTSPITRRRTFVFSETADGNQFFIDGRQFDPDRVDTRVAIGDVEEWTIENTSGEVHAFHIHQTDFLVTEINGVPQTAHSLHDTVNMPYAVNGVPSVVRIVIPFTEPQIAGRFVYHCHILEHEDGGMMQVIEVRPRGGTPTAPTRGRPH